MSVYTNKLNRPGESLKFRMDIPEDFHWEDLTIEEFFGEIYDTENDKYYSRNCGRDYRPKSKQKHLDEGHFQGYSFGVERFCPEGGRVLDPFVGSGTAIIESYLQGRHGVGIEVEFNQLLDDNIKHIQENHPTKGSMERLLGDCREVLHDVNEEILMGDTEQFDLVITGFPYPIISGNVTSDAPMNPNKNGGKGFQKIDYEAEKSLGKLKWKGNFRPEMAKVLTQATQGLKVGGHFITLIKDCVNNKKAFLLQDYVNQDFMAMNPNFEIKGWYIHRHCPETMFMRTYNKRFPDVKIPFYQVGLVLEKISE